MLRLIAAGFMACTAIIPISCANHSRSTETAETPRAKEKMDQCSPRDTVAKVMQAKLANAQAVLEGIALADYAQIETNALALKRVSEGGDWLVQESPSYFTYSAEFREICDDLANHAHAKNLQALASDYANLTNSCVACHSYLRAERPFRDMPGRVSMSRPPRLSSSPRYDDAKSPFWSSHEILQISDKRRGISLDQLNAGQPGNACTERVCTRRACSGDLLRRCVP